MKSDIYDGYFQEPRQYNRAVYKALYVDNILTTAGPLSFAVNVAQTLASETKAKTESQKQVYENF
jgi:hypothetical protein